MGLPGLSSGLTRLFSNRGHLVPNQEGWLLASCIRQRAPSYPTAPNSLRRVGGFLKVSNFLKISEPPKILLFLMGCDATFINFLFLPSLMNINPEDSAGCEKPFDLLGIAAFERTDIKYALSKRAYSEDSAFKTD